MSIQSYLKTINQTPHAKKLNITLVSHGETFATLKLPFSKQIIGDCVNNYIHSGAVSTAIDTACGAAILKAQNNLRAMATLDLRIDHIRPAASGADINVYADCYHLTHTIAFVRASAYTDDINNPVATAVGSFMRSNKQFPVQ